MTDIDDVLCDPETVRVLGVGQLNWPRRERVSDRYGVVGLYNDAHWQAGCKAHMLRVSTLAGRVGTLRAVVLETREADHIGDLTHGWHPGGAQVGDVIELGTGKLITAFYEGGHYVGIEPLDGRTTQWLDGPALYKCHSQTVRLEFVQTEVRE